MLDIGLTALLDRIESYFGKTFAKALLGLVVGCVVLSLAGVAWNAAIQPIVEWGSAESGKLKTISTILSLISITWAIIVGAYVATIFFAQRRQVRLLKERLRELAAELESEATPAIMSAVLKRLSTDRKLVREMVLIIARKDAGELSEEQVSARMNEIVERAKSGLKELPS